MKPSLRTSSAVFIAGLFMLAATLPVAASTNANSNTSVVTSIKPLELLVRAVATSDTTITSLVGPGGSPHNYTLRPSQRRALEKADAIFWVGPDMESFLTRLLANEDFRGRTHQLMESAGVHEHDTHREQHGRHSHDESHSHQKSHDHDEDHNHREHHAIEESHSHGHGHSHSGEDPHLWVDPQHAREMARAIAAELIALNSANAQVIEENLSAFEQRLNASEASIRQQLQPLRNHTLFAYHSAFTRFAEHYGLNLQGVLTLNPALSPGAKHIAEVQTQLQQAGRACLLTEPQFNTQWWTSITEGLNITFSTWDPLATDIPVTADGYIQFQQSIADAVLACR